MKRLDYYLGIILLAGLLLLGNYGIEFVNAQRPSPPLKLIQVEELDIVDRNGNKTASFGVAPTGKPFLSMLARDSRGASFNMIEPDSITIASDKQGIVLLSRPLPQLALYGDKSKTHALISLDRTGRGVVLLLDSTGNVTTSLPPKPGDPLYTPGKR